MEHLPNGDLCLKGQKAITLTDKWSRRWYRLHVWTGLYSAKLRPDSGSEKRKVKPFVLAVLQSTDSTSVFIHFRQFRMKTVNKKEPLLYRRSSRPQSRAGELFQFVCESLCNTRTVKKSISLVVWEKSWCENTLSRLFELCSLKRIPSSREGDGGTEQNYFHRSQ